jgi:mono/diheme cytochrome c family protein
MRAPLFVACLITSIAACTAAAGAQNLPHPPDPQAGQRLAMRVCDACHIVAPHQELSPLVPNYGPSWFDVANRPDTTAQSLEAFLARPHPFGQMPYPALTPAQVADVSAYILSLRRRR